MSLSQPGQLCNCRNAFCLFTQWVLYGLQFKEKCTSRLTKDPANSQTFTDCNKILTGSGGAVKVGELENVNSSLQTGRFSRRSWLTSAFMSTFPAQKMLIKINFNTHLRTKTRCTRKQTPQMTRTKISRLMGARNHRGNKSTAVVTKLSTVTNWKKKKSNFGN